MDDGSWPFCLNYLSAVTGAGDPPSGLGACLVLPAVWNRSSVWAGFPAKDLAGFPGGTPPHPDLTQQAHLPCDPHCSLLFSLGRCSHSLPPPSSPTPPCSPFLHGSWGTGEGPQPAQKSTCILPLPPPA